MQLKMEKLYLDIINNLSDGVYFVDNNRKIIFWNKAAERITGYPASEIVNKDCPGTLLQHIDGEGRPLCKVGCPLFATIGDGAQRSARVYVRHKKGYRVPIIVNIFPFYEKGEIVGAIEIFTQDSPKVYEDSLVEVLSEHAMHDKLTGLPNRRYLDSYLEYRIEECKRFNRSTAVVFADIDHFREFNNTYGHEVGDAVLRNVAESLKRNSRKDDLVGRWGGEEFVGIYSIARPGDAEKVGETFRMTVANTEVPTDKGALSVTVSVGVAVVSPDDTLKSVIERADALMYSSKNAGRNNVHTEISSSMKSALK